MTSSFFKGQVNSKFQESKGVIKGQGGQRCEKRSKVVNFIFYIINKIFLSFWRQPLH